MFDSWFTASWWNIVVIENTVRDYLFAGFYFLVLLLIFKAIQNLLLLRLERLSQRTRTDIDNAFVRILQTVKPSVYFVVALYLALRSLALPVLLTKVINAALIIVVVYQAVAVLQVLLDYIVRSKVSGKAEEDAASVIRFVSNIVKAMLWLVGFLFILSNIGINVLSLVAGLGVGGIAVALAAQNILGDLFSSLALYFDRPFNVGDYIVVDNIKGTVKQIGIKTTRIKSLDGEEVIMSNRELTSDRIKNYKRMTERRVAFSLGVPYETPREKLEVIPHIIEDIIRAVPQTRFDRAHFYSFDAASLSFRVVFFMTTPSYRDYMDARQTINYQIKAAFEAEQIPFAFPTQILRVEQPE